MFGVENTSGFILRWPGGLKCPTAYGFGNPIVKQSPSRESNVCRTEEGQLVAIRNEDSAPLQETTPSPSGTTERFTL